MARWQQQLEPTVAAPTDHNTTCVLASVPCNPPTLKLIPSLLAMAAAVETRQVSATTCMPCQHTPCVSIPLCCPALSHQAKKAQEEHGLNRLTPPKEQPEWLKFLLQVGGVER